MRALTTCVSSAILATVLAHSALASSGAKPAAAAAAAPAAKPSATLELASEQMRLIAGGSSGKGTLHYNGKDYAFTFKSASAGLGAKVVTSVSATGDVFGLAKVEDFEGRYNAASKSMIAGTSEAKATYSNSKGVRIELRGTVKGAGLSLGAGTASIKLVK